MRASLYTQLKALARRESGDAGAAEDMVQEALLAAVPAAEPLDATAVLAGLPPARKAVAATGDVTSKEAPMRFTPKVPASSFMSPISNARKNSTIRPLAWR